jgi:hypothetical protein
MGTGESSCYLMLFISIIFGIRARAGIVNDYITGLYVAMNRLGEIKYAVFLGGKKHPRLFDAVPPKYSRQHAVSARQRPFPLFTPNT